VVHRKGFGPNQWERLQDRLPLFLENDLREAARFDGDLVFELRR
jgi:hypothetical protein